MDKFQLKLPITIFLFGIIFLVSPITSLQENLTSIQDLFRSIADDPNFQNLYLKESDVTIEINNSSSKKTEQKKIEDKNDLPVIDQRTVNISVSERLLGIEKHLSVIKGQSDQIVFIINDMQNFIFGPLAWMCSENVKTSDKEDKQTSDKEEKQRPEISTPAPEENSDLPTYRYSTEFDNRFIRLMNWIKDNVSHNKTKKGIPPYYNDLS